MSIRRLALLILAVLLLVSGSAMALTPTLQEEIYAPEALLCCVESGQALYEKEIGRAHV